ncbi:Stp1/IreP family PP2C-type Ser/Thr phosphatase [Desulfolucanica intricata]|uniref:Stp1/IreP family PP2C-type Ser/Thr phosphatase n=1 Tax=Desulfolucanica intricata TaxID=1285191 RepID=UPI000832ECE4|nr:Stp1/IreP family PP2C-type Ser/Thr phosphatase [Desulfolucanica intricata]
MKWSKVTNTGMVRRINEDSLCVREDLKLFAVADGMGGHNAGEVASQLALKVLEEEVNHRRFLSDEPTGILLEAVQKANLQIYKASQNNITYRGMGTTITACWQVEKELYIAHVGDSRAFAIRNNDIIQLTEDHSLVQKLVNDGEITQEEARIHPRRNIITRALGTEPVVDVDLYRLTVKNGDKILVCTDGLTNHLLSDELLDIILKAYNLDEGVQALLRLALDRGGHDNISAVLVEIE